MYKMFKSVYVPYSSSLCLVMCRSNSFFICRRNVQALCCNRTCSKSGASFPRPYLMEPCSCVWEIDVVSGPRLDAGH